MRSPANRAKLGGGLTRDTPSVLTSVCLFDWNSGRQAWPLQAFSPSDHREVGRRPADWAVISFRRCSGHDVMKSRCSHTAVLMLGDCLASLSRCFCRAILQSKQTTWRFIMLR